MCYVAIEVAGTILKDDAILKCNDLLNSLFSPTINL